MEMRRDQYLGGTFCTGVPETTLYLFNAGIWDKAHYLFVQSKAAECGVTSRVRNVHAATRAREEFLSVINFIKK